MPATVRNSIVIARPVDEVFAFVCDPATTPRWQANVVRSEIVSGTPMGVGTRVIEVRQVGRARRQAEWVVTEYEPPSRRAYTYPTGFGPIRQSGVSTFTPVPGGTRIGFTATIEARGPLTLLLPVLARAMRRSNDASYAALKRILEADESASVSAA
jgi:uncharacterized protein YndB with AHSA1/START domain